MKSPRLLPKPKKGGPYNRLLSSKRAATAFSLSESREGDVPGAAVKDTVHDMEENLAQGLHHFDLRCSDNMSGKMLVERKCRVSLSTHPCPVFLAIPSLSALVHSRHEGLARPHVYRAGLQPMSQGQDQRRAAGRAELPGTVHGIHGNDAALLPLENSDLLNLPAFSLQTLRSIGSAKEIQ